MFNERVLKRRSGSRTLRRVLDGLSLSGWIAGILILILIGVAIMAPILLDAKAVAQDVSNSYAPPNSENLLGTDGLGRDVLARTLVATRLSLLLAAGSVLITMVIAVPVGAGLGMARRAVQRSGAAAIDISLSIPDILIAVVVVTAVGVSGQGALLAVGLAFVPYLTRVTYVLASSAAGTDFVAAARVLGVSRPKVLGRYILPNIGDGLVVAVIALFGESLVAVSALSFLGLGVQPPAVDLGGLLTTGVRDIYISPALALAPTVIIAMSGVALALLGDELAKALNPTARQG